MDKSAIKKFATTARRKLLSDVKQKAYELGITESGIIEPKVYKDGFQVNNHFFRQHEIKQYNHLVKIINQTNLEHVLDEVAYTWFNRLIAIRFMEVNDYLPSGIRLFSSLEQGKSEPDALTEIELLIDDLHLDRETIYNYQDKNDHNALFKYLLINQCNQLGNMMPLVFEEISSYMEILLPDYLLVEGSILYDLVHMIEEENWKSGVEIVGWMYQYYNAEKKDDVFKALKKNVKITKDNIPAATQLFTPRWIVQYMVDNSLGRLWLESSNDQSLKVKLPYYLESPEQPENVIKQLEEIKHKNVNPEDIIFLDPSMGSGHILIYAFEVLYEIYLSQGYRNQDIPKLILEKNLFGLEIDDRATQLAYFALMMKARQYNHRVFDQSIKLNVLAIDESNALTNDDIDLFTADEEKLKTETEKLLTLYKDAKLFGSILDVSELNIERLQERVIELEDQTSDNLFALEFNEYSLPIFKQLIRQTNLLQKKYDVVVTNPPYMGRKGMNAELGKYVKKHYKNASADLFAVFMKVAGNFTKDRGFIGMINQHAWMFLSSYEKLRKNLLLNYQIYSMAHLGTRAFAEIGGEVVQTTSFILRNSSIPNFISTFVRLTEVNNATEKAKEFLNESLYYERNQDGFSDIPGSPIAYWASDQVINVFKSNKKLGDIGTAKEGLKTGKNDRFLRLWFEVDFTKIGSKTNKLKWFFINKGGSYRKWYGNKEFVVNMENKAKELREFSRSSLSNESYYFKEGITWSDITSGKFSARYSSEDQLFETTGPTYFVDTKIKYTLALMNTNAFNYLTPLIMSTMHFKKGDVEKMTFIEAPNEQFNLINQNSQTNITLSKSDWDSFETSWDFKQHPILEFQQGTTMLADAFQNWEKEAELRFQTLKANEEELNRIFIDLYGLQDELTPEVEDKDVTVYKADQERDIKSFLSYLVGIMFGRYSLDEEGLVCAGGEFDPSRYKSFAPDEENVIPITDEVYFEDDIVGRIVKLLKVIFGEDHVEANLEFIADTLTRRRNETARERIRRYFMKEFYKDHVRTYQKRPIYWLIDSGRQDGFKALVYLHRYKPALLSRVRTQYLHPLMKKYKDEIIRMNMTMESDVSQAEKTKARKVKEKIEKQILECQVFDQMVAHMAFQQIDLDLDDGVKVNYDKFQSISVPQGEGKPALKANIFSKI